MSAKLFDPKCWDLACAFLDDVPGAADADRTKLAQDLQQAAEDAIAELTPPPAKREPLAEPEDFCWYGVERCTLPHCDCEALTAKAEGRS